MRTSPRPGGGRIRVAHIITKLELGGAQLNTLFTCTHLPRDRFEVHLLAGRGGVLDGEAERNGAVAVHFVPGLQREIHPGKDLFALVALFRCLRRIRPDIVHTHSSKAGILGRWAAWMAGVEACIHTYHGFGFHPGQSRWFRRLLVSLERRTSRITTHFITVSRATLRTGQREGVLDPDRSECLHSGVDLERLRGLPRDPRRLLRGVGADGGCRCVGMVACLKPQKAPEDFLRVAARVLPRVPEARFFLVGDGVLRRRLEDRIRRYGLSGRVHLLGWRRDVPEILAGLDVLVLTSRWEGLPRVFAEARAIGVPTVATRVGGAEEAVQHGRSGFLVEPGDLEGMARYVIRLLRDGEARRRMGEEGKRGLEGFDIHSMVARQGALYQELLARRRIPEPAVAGPGGRGSLADGNRTGV